MEKIEIIDYREGCKINFDKLIMNVFLNYCYIIGCGVCVADKSVLKIKADNSEAIERAAKYLKKEVECIKHRDGYNYADTLKDLLIQQKIFGENAINYKYFEHKDGELHLKNKYENIIKDEKALTKEIDRKQIIFRDRTIEEIIDRTAEKLGIETITEPQLTLPKNVLNCLQETICSNGKPFIENAAARPLKWLQNKQNLRVLLTHDKIKGDFTIAEIERQTPTLFNDTNGKPLKLSKNDKRQESKDTDLLRKIIEKNTTP
jgi:hypothetical protein